MSHGKRLSSFMLLLGCMVFFSTLGHAQYRGALRGTVTDPQGAVVSGATVTLLNTDTNKTMVSTSDGNGIYQFNALSPAHYKLTVSAPGFKQQILEDVHIIPEQPNALDLELAVGGAQEAVTVSATTETLDTATANVSGTISSRQIQSMPSFGRDVFKLVQLAPGVFGDGSQASGGGGQNLPGTQTGGGASGGSDGIFKTENGAPVAATGQQFQNNSYTIDGISTTSAVWGGSSVITPSQDSVESVKVLSNAYDAENGRFSGAQVQVTSKSGTNQYHGSLFFTADRPGLNAYQRFNGLGNKVVRDNNFFSQFGGSVGGPIWKNKIFAFFNYETVRSPHAAVSTGNGWYETAAFAKLAPTGSIAAQYLGFPGSSVVSTGINNSTCANAGLTEGVNCRTIAGQGLDIGSPLKTALGTQDLSWVSTANPGVGGGLDGVADIANFITQSTTHFSKAQYNGRVDANLTAKDHIGFSMYWVPQSSSFLNGAARGYNFFNHSQVNDAFTAIWNRTLSSSFLNEVRVNAAGWRWNEITSNPQAPVGLPSDNIGGIGSINVAKFGPNVGSILNQWTYGLKDVATKVVGRHTFKFGGDVTRLLYLQNCAGCGVPNYTFFNLWDFLNDAPHFEGGSFDPHTGTPSTIRQDQRADIWGFFAQDDFKLRRNLTLNLGLRWSYFGPLSSKQGNLYVATPGAGSNYLTGLTVHKGHSWNAQKDNFGPQIGFAWSPSRFHDKLVVRGGYGLNYNQEEIAISSNISSNPGLVINPSFNMSTPTSPNPGIVYAVSSGTRSLTGYPANPNAVGTFGANGLPTTGKVNVAIFPNTLPTARTHHYSLETEYEISKDLIATLRYLGSLSRDVYFHENPLAVPATLGYAMNPQIGGGDLWGVDGYGNYNALQAEVRHQFSRQFMADAQFVWSKTMDTSSGPYSEQSYPYNIDLNYAPSDYNVGKAFKIYAMWQPVFFHGEHGWLEKIAGGWSLSGIFNVHSGFPWSPSVSVQGGSLYCGVCGYTTVYPAAITGGPGTSTSNDQFKTGSNYPKGGAAYFSTPTYTAYSGSNAGTSVPQVGLRRNSQVGPGYRALDMTLAKSFGLPNMPVLGENAKFEFRMDAYNVFNNLNFNPTSISGNIASSNFGQATSALSGRVVTMGARFSF
jgi:Carboxypeptidase regulatory-like domain